MIKWNFNKAYEKRLETKEFEILFEILDVIVCKEKIIEDGGIWLGAYPIRKFEEYLSLLERN